VSVCNRIESFQQLGDAAERVIAKIKPKGDNTALGYSPKREPQKPETIDPETGEIQNGFGDSPCAELNALALSLHCKISGEIQT